MLRFALKRLIETGVLLFLLSLLVFVLFKLIPGDYLSEMEATSAFSRQTVQELRREYGLDQPVIVQYFVWLGQILRGNFGYSFAQQRSALDVISERLANTLILTASAFVLTVAISFPAGIVAALYAGRWPDKLALFASVVGLSLPSLLASLLFLYLAFWTGWFPIGGMGGLHYLALPSLTLALPSAAFVARTLRLEMIDALRQPYIITALAKGLPQSRVIFHALKNAVNPILSLLGILLGALLSGSVVVEKVFNWPGLGALTVDSILSRDLFVVLNSVLIAALLTVAANFLADLALAWNDPRVRYQ